MRTLILVAILAGSALAHHGWNGYDSSKPLKLTGTIVESSWANPHASLRLQVTEGSKTWTATLAPLSRMTARGLKAESLKTGRTATVEGLPSKSNRDEVKVERLILDSKSYEIRR